MAEQNTGDRTWGSSAWRLADTEHFGRPSPPEDYVDVTKERNQPKFKDCTQASHCMFYAKNNDRVFGVYNPRATVLMQMRFDGYIGFPGGLVDSGEDSVVGLNRELVEELNLDLSKHSVKSENYVFSHYNDQRQICLHFYAVELSLDDLKQIEIGALNAKDYGCEVLGTVRVPLYIMGDSFRGFPVFLNHSFIGNSRNQLLSALKHVNIMTQNDVNEVLQLSKCGGK